MVICQGCGQAVAVPEGYSRNKIQCSACGVICPVPADARRPERAETSKAGPPRKSLTLEDEAANWLKDSEPVSLHEDPPRFDDPPPRIERADPEPTVRKQSDQRIPCRRCGKLIHKQRECPECDGVADTGLLREEPEPNKVVRLAPHSLELDEPDSADPDEDASPYLFAEKDLPRCPKCLKEMAEGSVLCAECGFNRRTRKKAGRSYEPIARSWETNMTMQTRLILLGVGEGAHLMLAVFSCLGGVAAWPFLIAWPLLTALLCFVLGTYNRLDLTRDARGRVKVTITWRCCFVPLKGVETDVRGFEGVTTGQWHDPDLLDWFVCLSLLPVGVIPAIIWWYNVIYKEHYHVALSRDHGHAEVYVYRGRSAEQMSEITVLLCNAAGLKNVS